MKIKNIFSKKVTIEEPIKADLYKKADNFDMVTFELKDLTDRLLMTNQEIISKYTQNAVH